MQGFEFISLCQKQQWKRTLNFTCREENFWNGAFSDIIRAILLLEIVTHYLTNQTTNYFNVYHCKQNGNDAEVMEC